MAKRNSGSTLTAADMRSIAKLVARELTRTSDEPRGTKTVTRGTQPQSTAGATDVLPTVAMQENAERGTIEVVFSVPPYSVASKPDAQAISAALTAVGAKRKTASGIEVGEKCFFFSSKQGLWFQNREVGKAAAIAAAKAAITLAEKAGFVVLS